MWRRAWICGGWRVVNLEWVCEESSQESLSSVVMEVELRENKVDMAQDDIRIVYADEAIAVVEKPTRLLSVPGRGEHKKDCVIARVRERLAYATGPMVVHRLDYETTGLIVVALTPASQVNLSMQFEDRLVDKAYAALLSGIVPNDEGLIRMNIRVDWDNRPKQIVCNEHGRDSVTRYRVMSREIDRTRILFLPVTGRSHQLRVHAAFVQGLGMPILGDPLYGDATSASTLCLHASMISFTHPVTRERMVFTSVPNF